MVESLNEKIAARPCATARVEILHHQEFALPTNYPLDREYNVVSCSRCGFVYADVESTQNDYNHFYAEHSKYDAPRNLIIGERACSTSAAPTAVCWRS